MLKSLFNIVAGLRPVASIKTDARTSVFLQTFKDTFFPKHLRTTGSVLT